MLGEKDKMAKLVAKNTYLKNKTTALQVQSKFRVNKKVGYDVVKVNLKSKGLKPSTIKTFKKKTDAQKFARGY